MKREFLIGGLFIITAGSLFAQPKADSIYTLQATDTPALVAVSSTETADASPAVTTTTTTTTPAIGAGNDVGFLQLSLTPEIALEPRTTLINGLSLNIWGENEQHGLTLGIVNGSTGDSAGFTWGIVNYSESYKGVSWGVVNYNREYYAGWQRGVVNISCGRYIGYQSGGVNISHEFTGLQVGVVNYANELTGVQLGLVNIAANNPWFTDFPEKLAKGFPILNWSF